MNQTKKASEVWAVAPIKFADKMKEQKAIEKILKEKFGKDILLSEDYHNLLIEGNNELP